MRLARLAGSCALGAALLAIPLAPAHGAALMPGTLEVNGDLVLDHSTLTYDDPVLGELEDTTLNFGLVAGLGWSLSEPLQLGLGASVTHQSVDSDVLELSTTVMGLTGDVTWNFSTATNLIPFVRAGVGFQTYSGDLYDDAETTLILPFARAGVRVMVGESASVNVSLGYARETNAAGIEDADANRFNARVGLSIFPIRGQ